MRSGVGMIPLHASLWWGFWDGWLGLMAMVWTHVGMQRSGSILKWFTSWIKNTFIKWFWNEGAEDEVQEEIGSKVLLDAKQCLQSNCQEKHLTVCRLDKRVRQTPANTFWCLTPKDCQKQLVCFWRMFVWSDIHIHHSSCSCSRESSQHQSADPYRSDTAAQQEPDQMRMRGYSGVRRAASLSSQSHRHHYTDQTQHDSYTRL